MTDYEDLSDEHREQIDETLEKIEDHIDEALRLQTEMAEVTHLYTGQNIKKEKEAQAIEYCKQVLKDAARDEEKDSIAVQKVLGMTDQVRKEIENEIAMDQAEGIGNLIEEAISEMTGGQLEVEAKAEDVIEVKEGETKEEAIERFLKEKEREESDHYE